MLLRRFAIIGALVLLPQAVRADDTKSVEVAASAAYMFESDSLYLAEPNQFFYVGDTFLLKGEATYYLPSFSRRFGVGGYVNFGVPFYDGYEETTMIEIGPAARLKFPIDRFLLMPALYLGYRMYGNDAGSGFGINFSVLAGYPLDKFTPFLDVGFLTQPAGGNDATDITFAPVFIVGGGVMLGI